MSLPDANTAPRANAFMPVFAVPSPAYVHPHFALVPAQFAQQMQYYQPIGFAPVFAAASPRPVSSSNADSSPNANLNANLNLNLNQSPLTRSPSALTSTPTHTASENSPVVHAMRTNEGATSQPVEQTLNQLHASMHNEIHNAIRNGVESLSRTCHGDPSSPDAQMHFMNQMIATIQQTTQQQIQQALLASQASASAPAIHEVHTEVVISQPHMQLSLTASVSLQPFGTAASANGSSGANQRHAQRRSRHHPYARQAVPARNRGITRQGRRKLKSHKATPEQLDEICAICHDKYTQESTVTQLPCKHAYHDDCVGKWFEDHRSCPVCRHEVN